jgi:hypothetical protein
MAYYVVQMIDGRYFSINNEITLFFHKAKFFNNFNDAMSIVEHELQSTNFRIFRVDLTEEVLLENKE